MNLVKMVLPRNLVTQPKSLVTVTIAIDVDTDEEARVIPPANLATMKTLKKQLLKPQLLKPLFFDETLAEAVEDVAVVTPLMNLVTLPKSLVTVTIAIDVDADEEARVMLLANLATMKTLKKQLLKPQRQKPLCSDETLVEAVEDAAVVTPPMNLVKTV